jgi:hypothetical protein
MSNIPAHLIVGPQDDLIIHATQQLRAALCPQQGKDNCFCTSCRWINNRQHPALVWICPESDYALDDIEIIFEKTKFHLDSGTSFFFVLEKANQLTQATANRLLKIIEEPPAGYHFLLLSTNAEAVIATIRSRCVLVPLATAHNAEARHPLLTFFLNAHQQQDPFSFEQELKKQGLDDAQSSTLFETLAHAIAEEYKQALLEQNHHELAQLAKKQALIERNMRRLPQSGSSDLFWKQLWLRWQTL